MISVTTSAEHTSASSAASATKDQDQGQNNLNRPITFRDNNRHNLVSPCSIGPQGLGIKMTARYLIKLEPDDNDTLLVTCPALPEVTTTVVPTSRSRSCTAGVSIAATVAS